jgi:sterol desaturase/sphingolipid hydroxylase (fatty acid hydroxylase superfamily)
VYGAAAIEHLKYVLTSPRYHHWHHSSDEEAIDKNYVAHR